MSEPDVILCDDWMNEYSLNKIKADAIREMIEVYKKEYMGQGVVAMFEDYADELEKSDE